MKPTRILLGPIVAAALAFLSACSKHDDHAGHAHATAQHAHTAPHGGTLVEIGEHAYNLELVRDAAAGKLTVYVLDGHAENFVRIKSPSLEIAASGGASKRLLALRAVANSATGETVGDTSCFEAQADWLKTESTFDASLAAIEIKGTNFTAIAFNFPKGAK
ncbi:MAG: hypothetical protein HZA93_07760 [Verrucomicrobia bacterium]|nr:hypothetical protein [Verrucomicrobiota bacterium]